MSTLRLVCIIAILAYMLVVAEGGTFISAIGLVLGLGLVVGVMKFAKHIPF